MSLRSRRPDGLRDPSPASFVACIDVLEHIEPELLDNVLDDLRRVTAQIGVFTVHTGRCAEDAGGRPQRAFDSAAAVMVVTEAA